MADTADRKSKCGTWLAFAQLGCGMALFGSATPVSKLVAEALPPLVGALLRVAIGALVLLPFALGALRGLKCLARRDWAILGGIALFGMFGFSVLMLYGMRLVPGVVGSVVMSATPAITAVAAFLFMGDRLGARKIVAIALAVVGVTVMHLGGSGSDSGGDNTGMLLLGSALVLGAVCCEAAYTLLGKVMTDSLSPLLVTLLAAAMSVPLFAIPAAIQLDSADFEAMTWGDWAAVAWWGGGTMGLGSLLWYSGLAKVSGSTAAGFMGIMPLSALILSYLLLKEPFQILHLVGFGAVFAGVILIGQAHRRAAETDN